ncbi:Sensor protein FixL [Roseimaritima multifibrata]|uniref:Sensor protein FixL n=1 Tax=Roseimaritima multifibrata TaxID=1930274 RepID=A0A517MGZ0_9BACT|nr:PAS domain S-box protein [Roseimaritima multifibrata]QDS94146.1 Sensor protein FixL [Roseimaritima multifibrata]
MNEQSTNQTTVQRLKVEIRERMGVCPSFFLLAEQSPDIMESLWRQAEVGYLDNPLPSLFKEKLFTYLSRFCSIPYCVARHGAFLLGSGYVAGDPACEPVSVDEMLHLIQRPAPTAEQIDDSFAVLAEIREPLDTWPEPGGELETAFRVCCVPVFRRRGNVARCQAELRRVLGTIRYDQLMALLEFIRTTHFWTETHPDIRFEDDVQQLFSEQLALARWIKSYPTAVTEELQRADEELAELRTVNSELELRVMERTTELRLAQTAARMGTWQWDVEGDRLTWDATQFELFGIAPTSTVTLETFFNLVDPRDRLELKRVVDEVLESGIRYDTEFRIIRPDGVTYWIEGKGDVIRDKDNKPLRMIGVNYDVTDRKASEDELKRRERELRTLAGSVPGLFSYIDRDLRYQYVNRGYENAFRLPADEIVGKTVVELLGTEQFELTRPYIETVLGGEEVTFDSEFDWDDDHHAIQVTYVPNLDAQRCVQGFFCLITDITKLRRAERELTRLAAIVESSHDAIIGQELDGRIQSWNDAAEQIYGYSREEAVGQSITMIVPADRHDEIRTILERIRRGQRVETFETVRVCRDGRHIDVSLTVSPIKEHTGRVIGSSAIARDISTRKEAEVSLRESERMFRALFEQAGGYCMLLRPTDSGIPVIIDINEAACDAHGYSRSEMIGKPVVELDDEEGKGLCRERTQIIMSGKTLSVETNHVRKNGSVFPVEVTAKRVQVAGKPPIIMTTEHDITERKQAEQKLRDREERLRAILNAAVDSIVTIDRQGIIKSINSATERMFGYTQDELIGQNVKILMPQPYRREHDGYLSRYRETGETHIIGVGREVAGQRKDGSTFPVDLAVSEVENLSLFTGIIRDITDRKQAEESLRREHEFSESLTNMARNIVLVLDTGGRIVRFNPYMEELTGWQLDEVQGRDWFDTFLPEHSREKTRSLFRRGIAGERTHGNVSAILTKDGHEREIEWYDTTLTGGKGEVTGLLTTGLDVTERRMLEREILEIAAEEQRRIGQELHDSTQQQLTGLGLVAQNVAESLEQLVHVDEAVGMLERVRELHRRAAKLHTGLDQAAREVNHLARGLVPVELDAQGLMSSLAELVRSVGDVQDVECKFINDRAVDVPDNFCSTHLYRVAQEAVNNALKHSRADRIEVSLSELDDLITLKVLDNGDGIEEKSSHGPGMGLRIMAYRADLIGATLHIGQATGGGTEVVCTISQ